MELVELGVKGTEVIPQEVEDPYQVIYNVVDEFLAQARNDRLVAKMFVLVDQAQNKYATPTAVYNIAAQVNTVFSTVPLIKSGQEKGIFRAGDPLALSYTLWNALQGVMQGIAQDPHMPIPEAEWLMAILQGK